MNQGLGRPPRGQSVPWPRRAQAWLTESAVGVAIVLLLAVAVGCAVVWALHPTFPPRLILLDPEEGSWSWLLHSVFDWRRSLAVMAAALTAIGLLGWWVARRLHHHP